MEKLDYWSLVNLLLQLQNTLTFSCLADTKLRVHVVNLTWGQLILATHKRWQILGPFDEFKVNNSVCDVDELEWVAAHQVNDGARVWKVVPEASTMLWESHGTSKLQYKNLLFKDLKGFCSSLKWKLRTPPILTYLTWFSESFIKLWKHSCHPWATDKKVLVWVLIREF